MILTSRHIVIVYCTGVLLSVLILAIFGVEGIDLILELNYLMMAFFFACVFVN